MAYAAAVYLRQLVEQEFIQILCRILEFEETEIRVLYSKVNGVLNELKTATSAIPASLPGELLDYVGDFRPKTLDVDYASLFNKVRLNDRDVLNRVPIVMDQRVEVKSILEKFLEHQELVFSLRSHSSELMALENYRKFVNLLVSLLNEFEDVVSLLNTMAEEAISLHDILGTFLLKAKNVNDDSVVNQIKVKLGHVGDKIEDLLAKYPLGHFGTAVNQWDIDIESLLVVKNDIDNLKEAIDGFELNTLEEMSCIRREEPESYRRSQPRRPRAWILKWQHLFCIRPECEEDTEFNSFPETKRLQIEGTEGEKDHGKGSRKSSIKGEDIVMGLDDELTKIVDELTRPPAKLVMVTIAGMSGIGKTTLARKVYGNKRVLHHFDYAAWVCGKSILDQAFSQILNSIQMASDKSQERVTEETHGKSIGDKGQSLWRILRKKRYLIVVDDFWDSNWNAIERYFPDDQVGSRILVTSRSKKFCTNVPQNSPHCLRLLNADQSWKMLEILVFRKESCPSELVDVGEAIATTCGGLRLTIAGILHNIPRSSISWKNLRGYIRSDAYVNSVSCLDILSLSYKYLPYHLKACFLFMGSFPANCEIDAKKMLNLWVAGGFLDLIPSQPAEKVAGEYLEDLISRCLVLVGRRNFDGKIKTCYMHDLLHQLCLQKAYEEGFKQQHLISNARIASDLSLHLNYHLRSFMLLTPHSDVSPDKLILHLASCTRLRVLDMYFLPLDSFPTKIFHLVNLRYLALNMTYMVDAGISQFLWKLECLVVYGPWIPKVDRSGYLPTLYLDCWKMPWLRNVSVRLPSFFKHSTLPQRLPDGSAIMSDLQTLSTITFSSCTAEVLSLMPRLKKLGVFITKHNLENEAFRRCFENLQSMTELGILKCSFFEGSSQGS